MHAEWLHWRAGLRALQQGCETELIVYFASDRALRLAKAAAELQVENITRTTSNRMYAFV
jgi:hypothetical protein